MKQNPIAITLVFISACLFSLDSPIRGQQGELFVDGYVGLRGLSVRAPVSWLEGGFGRFATGAADSDDHSTLLARADIALEWLPGEHFGAYLHLSGRGESSEALGNDGGVVEAYVQAMTQIRADDELRIRLGTFFLPTTLEAIDRPWTSPYTLSLSALNTWIGEEVRPTGLLAEYTLVLGNADRLRLGASLFGGNDTSGALLAWRGWSMGDRLSTYGEFLPIPPLESLAPGGGLAEQREEGTRPLGDDLDGRPGWATTLRWLREGRGGIRYTHFDNRGDRALHRGEYAWRTNFDLLGVEWHPSPWFSLLGEGMKGDSSMGFAPDPRVAFEFEAYYLMASWKRGPVRISLRHDQFATEERDFSTAENNDDDGEGWTLALFWEPGERFRAGVEFLTLHSRRPELANASLDPSMENESLSLELRYFFGG